ncbi:MAG: hypothetical protein HRU19_09570 [Pseudobacteriovorax sp.]|nr:hypothetical protein [Pseudobacteriovorax sp.]
MIKIVGALKWRLTIGLFVFLISGLGCVTNSNHKDGENIPMLPGQKIPGKVEFWILKRQSIVVKRKPLPNQWDFVLELRGEDEVLGGYLKYRGWDFNRDGIADMLEEFSPEGVVVTRSFDFDHNGQVELIKASTAP